MLGLTYESWKQACEMNLKGSRGRQRYYLQSFPYSKLSAKDKDYLSSETFFLDNIDNGAFILFDENSLTTDNYMQKGDGSFRISSLISPILYLILQSVGIEIAKKYNSMRSDNISNYYSGNVLEKRAYYKHDYNEFFKEVNACASAFQHFIKTDISDFYQNINDNTLFSEVNEVVNKDKTEISQLSLQLYKELLCFCCNGKSPVVENSTATSFLATIVYLDKIDQGIDSYIRNNINQINDYKIIRYVDDMYIFFSCDTPINPNNIYNEIKNEYSSLLKSMAFP